MNTKGEAKAKVWLEMDGSPVIGRGRAHLLQEIESTGSISEAARSLGLSYRYAWGMIEKMRRASGGPVVKSTRGGRGGGRSVLTAHGRELLEAYLRVEGGKMAKIGPGSEIQCRVVSIDESEKIVVLESRGDEGLVTVTVKGTDLSGRARVGEEITLLLR